MVGALVHPGEDIAAQLGETPRWVEDVLHPEYLYDEPRMPLAGPASCRTNLTRDTAAQDAPRTGRHPAGQDEGDRPAAGDGMATGDED